MKLCKNCRFKESTDLCSRTAIKDCHTNVKTGLQNRESNHIGHCGYYEYDWLEVSIVILAGMLAGCIVISGAHAFMS